MKLSKLAFVYMWAVSAVAQDLDPAQFDTSPRDGRLNKVERTRYYLKKFNPGFNQLDINNDGIITQQEQEAWAGVDERDIEVAEAIGKRLPYSPSVEELRRYDPPKEESEKAKSAYKLQLRKSHDQYHLDQTEAEPATFSYVRDYLHNDDIWSAQGALIRPFLVKEFEAPAAGGLSLQKLDFVPSVTFNRTSSQGSVPDVDELSFRAGLDMWVQGGVFDLMVFAANARVDTHFDFNEARLVGEVDWQPILLNPSINGSYKALIPNVLLYRGEFMAHSEFGQQLRQTQTTGSATAEDDFVRVGPSAGIAFRLHPDLRKPFSGVTASLHYRHLWEITGSDESTSFFHAALYVPLDPDEHAALSLDYRWGETEAEHLPIKELKLGLALKF